MPGLTLNFLFTNCIGAALFVTDYLCISDNDVVEETFALVFERRTCEKVLNKSLHPGSEHMPHRSFCCFRASKKRHKDVPEIGCFSIAR
jgi:hypothetical protein